MDKTGQIGNKLSNEPWVIEKQQAPENKPVTGILEDIQP